MSLFPRSGGLAPASPQTTKVAPIPAAMGGINAVDGLTAMPPSDAIFLNNLVPSTYGLRVRTGYTEWATSVGSGGVRTIIPFIGSSSSFDRMFGCAQDGIYDCSSSGAIGAAEISFATSDATSGYGSWVNFVNDAGAYFCLYCDETNGYYVYTSATDTWAKITLGAGATQISGVDPANLAYVMIFKKRVWFIEKNTNNAWYLSTNAIYGAATQFNFGNKFRHGGTLQALYSWTVDGGAGIDDLLVAVSTGGDVIIYKGTDPATATDWFQQGSWFIGATPAGRRIAGSFGGELYLLSVYGLIPATKLISGALIQQENVALSRKITPLISQEMFNSRSTLGWEVKLVSTENLILVSTPKRTGYDYKQFVQSINFQGWSNYLDIPYYTGEEWKGEFYIGASDGTIYIHTGNLDGVTLDGLTYSEISSSALQAFNDHSSSGLYHRAQFVRPVFLSQQPPAFNIQIRYDYNLDPYITPPNSLFGSGTVWDTGVWDVALWLGEFNETEPVFGGSGIGRAMAVGISMLTGSETVLVRYDLMYDTGGAL